MVDSLNEQEQLLAARTSYAFWAWEVLQSDGCTASELCIRMATKEAKRHYIAEDGNYDKALERMKGNLAWRSSEQVDLLKVCFAQSGCASSDTVSIQLTTEQDDRCRNLENIIEKDLLIQRMAVRGYDKAGRAIVVKLRRGEPWPKEDTSGEGYRIAQVFVAERAIAATELRTLGTLGAVTAIFDSNGYVSANSPPISVVVETVKTLQANYPERLGKLVVIGAPFWMQAFVTVVTPLLAAKTRDKLLILGSSPLSSFWGKEATSDEDLVRQVVEADQAMPFMLPDGKLTSPIDVEQQTRRTPFSEVYDFEG